MHLAFFFTPEFLYPGFEKKNYSYGNFGCHLAKYNMRYSRIGGPLWDVECIAKLRWQVPTTILSSSEAHISEHAI